MKKKKTLTIDQKYFLLTIASSIVNAGVLALSILAISFGLLDDFPYLHFLFGGAFFFSSIAMADLALFNYYFVKSKIGLYKNIAIGGIYLIISILLMFLPLTPLSVAIFSGIYLLTLSANRICRFLENRRIGSKVFNIILASITFIAGLIMFFMMDPTLTRVLIVLVSMIMMMVSLVNIMLFAFSRMQVGAMIKIMRKTYVIEVIYGLLVLIVSFSFIFLLFEEGFKNYGDALWYCFAIVTTIGFGDFTTVGVLGRILSVILGIYGIIVVALITSVIVNFYNEVKDKKSDEIQEQAKKIEKEKENKAEDKAK